MRALLKTPKRLFSLSLRHSQCLRSCSFSYGLTPRNLSQRFEDESYEQTEPSFSSEELVGDVKTLEYQSETKRLLNIVTNSLYKNKEIFIRELISNSSDAVEKHRQQSLTLTDPTTPQDYKIELFCDDKTGTFTIVDNGCGMTQDELERNIGTICYSGSEAFKEQLSQESEGAIEESFIGQFGVGFYSVFMVADEVTVYTKSKFDESGWCWSGKSDESSFRIQETSNVPEGTKIVLKLKTDAVQYAETETTKDIVQKYSNFIQYPIFLNGNEVETLEAIWLKPKEQITEPEHEQFFEYLSHSTMKPLHTIMIDTDAPIDIKALFYVPPNDVEMFGGLGGQQESVIHLYSQRVLIESKDSGIVPIWLRFLKGVVESDDLSLNISRETVQNSSDLMNLSNISRILTKKIINSFGKMMNGDFEKYERFYNEFEKFLKEGITIDFVNKDDIAKLLLYESSKSQPGEKITLKQYCENIPDSQKEIYYHISTSREVAETSPYFEVFKEKDMEVIFSYNPMDDFVFASLAQFNNKTFVPLEHANIQGDVKEGAIQLTNEQANDFCQWIEMNFYAKIKSAAVTNRLNTDTPGVINNPASATYRLVQQIQDPTGKIEVEPQEFAINPSNQIIRTCYEFSKSDDVVVGEFAKILIEQVIDMALMNANLLEDSRLMLTRLNKILSVTSVASKELWEDEEFDFKDILGDI